MYQSARVANDNRDIYMVRDVMIDRNSATENIVSVGGAGSECALSVENLG